MDEKTTDRTPTSTHTTINHTDSKPAGGGMMWFLMGGIIVFVAIVAYFVFGDGGSLTSGSSQPSGSNVSISVESNDAPATGTDAPTTETAPADPEPAQTAPVQVPQSD